jgi:amino acid adenylation domain-containing protein/non-ribosomal peptide synthase protein (TIGR01720 family)
MNAPDKKLLTGTAEQRQKEDLVRRFVGLPLERRRHFLTRLKEQGIDFSLLPIPAGLAGMDSIPLSFAQQRLWFFSRLDPDSTAYHMTGGLHVRGQLQADAVRAAFVNIQARHAALRTTFYETDGQAVQCIHESQALPYRELDFTNDQALDDTALRALAEAEARMPFDLEQGPLWRVTLVRSSDSEYEIWLSLHHIIADGWSLNHLMHEFSELYKADLSSPQYEMETARITYGDYAIWQRAWLEAGEADRQLAFWLSCLEGEQPALHLPEDHSRPVTPSNRGGRVPFSCDAQLTGQLRDLARKQGTTLSNILLAAFLIVLYRYSGQRDLRVGIPLANRDRAEIDRVVGFFVNTVVIRIPIQGRLSVHELLHAVRTAMIDAQAHPDLPFDQLVDALPHQRSLDRNPLFQVMYNHQQRAYDALSIPGLEVFPIDRDAGGAQLDLSLDTEELGTALQGVFTYALDLFERSTIERLAHHWQRVLAVMVKNPLQRIAEVPLLDEVEAHRILKEWNNATVNCTKDVYFHMLFEAQVARTPEATALIFPEGEREQRLTYAQLNTRANRLAHRLQSMGVGPDVLVGIAVERSIEMVIGLLAILKAGGAYVPLDPEYPAERLSYIMIDSGIGLLVTQEQLQVRLSIPESVQVLYLDGESENGHQESAENLPLSIQPDNLAYVIYTSGSTGKPKGVCVSIQSLTQHILTSIKMLGLTDKDRVLQFSTYNFDAFIEQLYPALCCGASIVVRGKNIWASDEFYQQLIAQSITVVDLPTQYWYQLIRDFSSYQFLDYGVLRQMNIGGEALPTEGLQIWRQAHLSHVTLLNMYGPTEATVTATALDCSNSVGSHDKPIVPIGRPLEGRCCYLLDEDLNPAPIGCTSELYLGGMGLARGYHGRPALTAERFVPDPYGEAGSRMYRTGDLVRYRPDGNIEYMGRIDHQLKIRGFRIELGEIESQLQAQAGVRNAVVLAQTGAGGQQQLVAYVVPVEGSLAKAEAEVQNAFRSALRSRLQTVLPEYMIPAQYVLLASLPLTPSGKLDRKALPALEVSAFQGLYEAPRTELERQLAEVWQSVLGAEQVGLNDNFFELGGDSIVSLQVVSRARQRGIHFTPKDVFQHQTLAGLATIAREVKQGMLVDQGPERGILPLLPIQRWFFEAPIPQRHHWNQSVLLKPSEPLQAGALQTALEYLLLHHDALRLSFTEVEGREWQAVFSDFTQANKALLWQRSVSRTEELEVLCNEAQRSLNLEQGPLLRAVLADLPAGEQRLLLVTHHLVVDGVSWRVLLEDLQTAYRQAQSGQTIRLPAKTDSVRIWSERLHQYALNDVLQQELAYWQTELAEVQGDLPRDNPEGSLQNKHARHAITYLDKAWTERLLKEAPAAYRTQINDLLLTALARIIVRWTRQSSVLIQLEGHGREDLFGEIDLTRTVGWFTTVFPVRLSPAESLDASIKTIKEQLWKVPNKGIGFGVLRYLGDEAIQQQLKALPEPWITFNYLGQFDSSFDAREGLFSPAGEEKGAGQSPEAPLDNWLSIDGQVYNGELKLGWTFSGDMYDETTIQGLADAYAVELQALIAHCCKKENYAATPSDFPLVHLTQAQLDALSIAAAEIDDIYPLSSMQQGMLFHSLNAAEEGAYVNQLRMDIRGLDMEHFRQAWQGALNRHAVLRAGFIWEGLEEPVQVIRRQVALPIQLHDWRERTEVGYPDRLADALAQLAQERLQTGFALNVAPLLRLDLVRVADDGYHMIYTNHHILMDGWSDSQLLGEVLQRYQGQTPVMAPGSYRDYLVWLQHRDPVAQERFWREQLQALEEPTLLANVVGNVAPRFQSAQLPESDQAETVWGDYSVTLTDEEVSRLSDFTKQQKVTINTVLQAAWLLLLQRYTGQNCVTFGATVAGRPAEVTGIEQQLGLFINTLPVVGRIDPAERIGDWARRIQVQNLALREYEHTPLYEIQRWAGQGGSALFDNIIVFENYPVAEALQKGAPPGLEFREIRHHEQTNYGLTLLVSLSDRLSLHYHYDRRQFSDAVIEQLNRQLIGLLKAFIGNADQAVGNLSLLDEAEAHRILKEWNATAVDYGEGTCIHSLFEAQAAQTPQAAALIFPQEGQDQHLSYAELNTRANQLAHRLRLLGIGPDVLVGIAVERSVEMVVGLLGILKAGGAYVPLDPDYPRERLSYMMADSGIGLLLTQERLQARLAVPAGVQVLCLDGEPEAGWHQESGENPPLITRPDNLAYVIYTSGSTGKPKGAGNSHRALYNRLTWMQGAYRLTAEDSILQKTPFSFDVSVWEFFWPLLNGAKLVVAAPGDHREPERLVALIKQIGITTLHFVPSMLQVFMQHDAVASCTSLRQIICSGEALSAELQTQVLQRLPFIKLRNLYGPTEAAIDVTHWTCMDDNSTNVPIGRPIANLQTYILDSQLCSLPVGVVGELYIGGAGLARGYHGRSGLTAERFIPDPYGETGGRLYRTGDLARYRSDGNIEYVGRIDHQVKIRGFRIELGEIESQLQARSEVRDAVVLAKAGAGGHQLVAYVVPAEGNLIEAEAEIQNTFRSALKSQLQAVLPEYMVPAQYVLLRSLPLMPNGKLDRKALPAVDWTGKAKHPPETAWERKLARLWQEILGIEQVEWIGREDGFFDLGGHSLLAMRLVAKLKSAWQLDLSIRDVFDHHTLAAQAEILQTLSESHADGNDLMSDLADAFAELQAMSPEQLEDLAGPQEALPESGQSVASIHSINNNQ